MAIAGIVRRLDELGRIVIPKEMRRTLHLNEGDEIEIVLRSDEITLKKSDGFQSILPTVKAVAALLARETGADALVVTSDRVVVAEGKNKKTYAQAALTRDFSKIVRERNCREFSGDALSDVLEGKKCDCKYVVYEPVSVRGDLVGGVLLLFDASVGDLSRAYLKFCVQLLQSALN